MESICEIDINGAKVWYNSNRLLHREDGPAFESVYGSKSWYINGKLHRIDGPAIKFSNGAECWYFNDTFIQCSSQEEFERLIKLKAFW
jgi:hypothetical protein